MWRFVFEFVLFMHMWVYGSSLWKQIWWLECPLTSKTILVRVACFVWWIILVVCLASLLLWRLIEWLCICGCRRRRGLLGSCAVADWPISLDAAARVANGCLSLSSCRMRPCPRADPLPRLSAGMDPLILFLFLLNGCCLSLFDLLIRLALGQKQWNPRYKGNCTVTSCRGLLVCWTGLPSIEYS
jgi:hypothetical protein